MDRFKSLDVYRKLPQDFVQPTYSGALLSIISSVLMSLLLISELQSYLEVKTGSEMYIDLNRGDDKLNVNIDIEMWRLPCSILSIDIQDVMGSHSVNIHGSLTKYNLSSKGLVIGEEKYKTVDLKGKDEDTEMPDYEQVKKQIINGEGCQIKGDFLVNKVPGNFHISSHAYGPIIQMLIAEGYFSFDVSHRINHLSFGEDKKVELAKKTFKLGEISPLDNTNHPEHDKRTYEYYMKVVPTTYEDLRGNTFYLHQFISNSNEVNSHIMLPAVYFRYDMSPITVKYFQYKENFLHFLTQICAIIGGIFAVTGIIDALVHKSVVSILKKASMGKLT